MKRIFGLILLTAVFASCLLPAGASFAEDEEDEETHAPLYIFDEHLLEAEASIERLVTVDKLTERKAYRTVPAQLEGDKFIFAKLENESAIQIREQQYDGESHPGIYFQPSMHGPKILRFFDVPTGTKMFLNFGVDDQGHESIKEAAVYFKILAGSHEIVRLRISNEKGWHEKVIDLGMLSLLKRNVSMTFVITADDIESRTFAFSAAIYKAGFTGKKKHKK